MGCDIHLHGEVKINGVWHHYTHPHVKRSYSLFSRMADVRNVPEDHVDYIEPIDQPRGIPEDASFITKFDCDFMDSDGHSHSWLSGEEVDELVNWYDAKRREWEPNKSHSFEGDALGYVFGNGWNVKKYPRDYPDGVEDARIVFWFDN